ncbi:MAG: anthrone oxygenase family protein [Ilumatobacteraceae bacterium]
MRTLTVATAVGAGIVGGVFFAFSTFVMAGLRQAPPRSGLAAMQGINRAAPSPVFMLALLGTAVACLGLGIGSLTDLAADGAELRVAGCAVYLVTIVVTIAYHIPRNNALADVDPDGADAIARWVAYAGPWTVWNHVRTVAGIGAAVLLTLGSRA